MPLQHYRTTPVAEFSHGEDFSDHREISLMDLDLISAEPDPFDLAGLQHVLGLDARHD